MQKKLMIYVQADLAPDAIRWAIRLSQTPTAFGNECIGHVLSNLERGLKQHREVPLAPWNSVNNWLLRQGKSIQSNLPSSTIQRAQAQQQTAYREALVKLEAWEKNQLEATKIVFQVQEGPDSSQTERWPEKVRRVASFLQIKPNELVNRMIDAGITALNQEDPFYEPDFVTEYQKKVVIPKIEQFQSEQKLAEQFDTHSDIPKELINDGWAFMGLNERANLHTRELIDGLLEGKPSAEVLPFIAADQTLSLAYLEKLESLYKNPIYQDWKDPQPLRDKRFKKEIIDALVTEWKKEKDNLPSEFSILEGIKSQLAGLSLAGLQMIQNETDTLISSYAKKPRPRRTK